MITVTGVFIETIGTPQTPCVLIAMILGFLFGDGFLPIFNKDDMRGGGVGAGADGADVAGASASAGADDAGADGAGAGAGADGGGGGGGGGGGADGCI